MPNSTKKRAIVGLPAFRYSGPMYGTTLNAGFFQGFRTSIAKKPLMILFQLLVVLFALMMSGIYLPSDKESVPLNT